MPALPRALDRRALALTLLGLGVIGLGVASASQLLVRTESHVASGSATISSGCQAEVIARYETGDLAADGTMAVTGVHLRGLDGCRAGQQVSVTLFGTDDQPFVELGPQDIDGAAPEVTLPVPSGSSVTNHDVARIGVVVR